MLFEALLNQLAESNNQIQLQIEALQARQRQILQEMQDVGGAESKVLAGLQLMREAIAETLRVCPSQMEEVKRANLALYDEPGIAGLLPSNESISTTDPVIVTPPPAEPESVDDESPAVVADVEVVKLDDDDSDLPELRVSDNDNAPDLLPDPEKYTRDELLALSIQALRKIAAHIGSGAQGSKSGIVTRIMLAGSISKKAVLTGNLLN